MKILKYGDYINENADADLDKYVKSFAEQIYNDFFDEKGNVKKYADANNDLILNDIIKYYEKCKTDYISDKFDISKYKEMLVSALKEKIKAKKTVKENFNNDDQFIGMLEDDIDINDMDSDEDYYNEIDVVDYANNVFDKFSKTVDFKQIQLSGNKVYEMFRRVKDFLNREMYTFIEQEDIGNPNKIGFEYCDEKTLSEVHNVLLSLIREKLKETPTHQSTDEYGNEEDEFVYNENTKHNFYIYSPKYNKILKGFNKKEQALRENKNSNNKVFSSLYLKTIKKIDLKDKKNYLR